MSNWQHFCMSVYVFCGVIGRKRGERKKCKNRGWEIFIDLTTHGSSVVKSTWPRVPISASVSNEAHLVSHIHPQEQDTGCPGLQNRGWEVKDL